MQVYTLWIQIKPIFEMIKNAVQTAFNFTPIGMAINGIKAVHAKIQQHKVKHNALGSASFGGGMTLVGEQGPELVNLPRGSRIVLDFLIAQLCRSFGCASIPFELRSPD